MCSVDIVRAFVMTGMAVLHSGCASHHAAMCRNPAKVFGVNSRDNQGGWVLVRENRSKEDTAARISVDFRVRAEPLTYLHGFSTYPMPQGPKFLCDKAIAEVHYEPEAVAAR